MDAVYMHVFYDYFKHLQFIVCLIKRIPNCGFLFDVQPTVVSQTQAIPSHPILDWFGIVCLTMPYYILHL